ncbi:MAG: methylase involved in ubiquinone/menaquinone biosynthesis [Candidatus Eremiobacteraeota bacterium]|nr:methylase involved in ubiquinone/menaquinone biosynthesis [Candidatus Eremiobacteraeota bacterium]
MDRSPRPGARNKPHVSAKAHIDVPVDGIVRAPLAEVHGWVAADDAAQLDRISLVNARGDSIPLTAVDRPDVRAAYQDRACTGFSGWIGIREAALGPWRVRYQTAQQHAAEASIDLRADRSSANAFAQAKRAKLARIRPLLRCPLCRAALSGEAELRCERGHAFTAGADAYDFRSDEVRLRGAFHTESVSAHGYDGSLLELIAAADGPVLDVGAGLRPQYRDDVVNLEIVPYPTTDVLAASERLPFADAAFALVISVAVLEHVRDPFAAAREIERIVAPGGRVFAAVPFLQPYHGYPDHYYNMTAPGLRNLFPAFDVERLDVPASGLPVFALTWMLKSWRDALPPEAAAAFDAMRVADLAVDPMTLIGERFVRELPLAMNAQLAALNVLVARKRG